MITQFFIPLAREGKAMSAKVTLLYPDEVPDRKTDEIEARIWEQIMNGTFGENPPITDDVLANIEPIDLTQYMRRDA